MLIARERLAVGLIIWSHLTDEAGTVEVQIGAVPVPWELNNCPLVPAALPGIKAPENWILPVTSSFCPGAVVPMPKLPVLIQEFPSDVPVSLIRAEAVAVAPTKMSSVILVGERAPLFLCQKPEVEPPPKAIQLAPFQR